MSYPSFKEEFYLPAGIWAVGGQINSYAQASSAYLSNQRSYPNFRQDCGITSDEEAANIISLLTKFGEDGNTAGRLRLRLYSLGAVLNDPKFKMEAKEPSYSQAVEFLKELKSMVLSRFLHDLKKPKKKLSRGLSGRDLSLHRRGN